MLERAIIGFLRIRRKTTSRQLATAQMVPQALATNSFFGARFIGAVAIGHVLFLITLHHPVPFIFYAPLSPKAAID
jgi:hypothetical protein